MVYNSCDQSGSKRNLKDFKYKKGSDSNGNIRNILKLKIMEISVVTKFF